MPARAPAVAVGALGYGEQKMTRAEHRFGEQRPLMRIGRRAEDLIAGAPSQPDPDP